MGPLGNIAANARERVDLDGTRAVVELIAQDMAGGNVAIYMNGRPELLTPNTSIPIDWHSFEGLIGRFEVLDLDFEFLGAMLDGVLSFEEVSTFAGQRVKGSFSAQVITVP